MPLSLFNNLSVSIQETEHLLNLRRSDYTHLKSRYDVHAAVAPARSTRLNHLARTSTDLLRQKAASRRKIEEEKQKLKSYEDARAAVAAELEALQADDMEKTDLRQQLLALQDEIVSIDDELQTFRMCARKIERRARQGRDAHTLTLRRQQVMNAKRSLSPVAVEVLVVPPPPVPAVLAAPQPQPQPPRQVGVEVRIPLRSRRVPARRTPDGSRSTHCQTTVDAAVPLEGSGGAPSDGVAAGARQLRSSRACVVRASIELPL